VEAIRITNKYRAEVGAKPLTCHVKAQQVATKHSRNMCATGQLTHDGFSTRCSQIPFQMRCGENVAYNYDRTSTAPQTTLTQWRNSAGHYRNMVNPAYTKVGVGNVRCTSDGKVMWTQIFG